MIEAFDKLAEEAQNTEALLRALMIIHDAALYIREHELEDKLLDLTEDEARKVIAAYDKALERLADRISVLQ